MKQSATIFVKGVQTVDEESDTIEFSSEGTVEQRDAALRLSYFELSDEGYPAYTVLTLFGETVRIERSGSDEMTFTVQKGKHRNCAYASPMGTLLIGTYGTALSHSDNALHLTYELDMNGVPMSRNELTITYLIDKEQKD